MYPKAILNRRWTHLRGSPSNGPKTTSVNQQGGELVTLELLFVIDRNGSTRETVGSEDAAVSDCPRLAVLSYCDGTDLDEFSSLEAAEPDGIAVKSQIGRGVVKRIACRRVRLPIINVHEHSRRGITLGVDRFVRILDILSILLERGCLASRSRARNEFRFFKIEFPRPDKRAALRKTRLRECAGDQTKERDGHKCGASIYDVPPCDRLTVKPSDPRNGRRQTYGTRKFRCRNRFPSRSRGGNKPRTAKCGRRVFIFRTNIRSRLVFH